MLGKADRVVEQSIIDVLKKDDGESSIRIKITLKVREKTDYQ